MVTLQESKLKVKRVQLNHSLLELLTQEASEVGDWEYEVIMNDCASFSAEFKDPDGDVLICTRLHLTIENGTTVLRKVRATSRFVVKSLDLSEQGPGITIKFPSKTCAFPDWPEEEVEVEVGTKDFEVSDLEQFEGLDFLSDDDGGGGDDENETGNEVELSRDSKLDYIIAAVKEAFFLSVEQESENVEKQLEEFVKKHQNRLDKFKAVRQHVESVRTVEDSEDDSGGSGK